jgi:DMSO/TMAO reductase YedYZ molybdopterin-dependent catalytic subunit
VINRRKFLAGLSLPAMAAIARDSNAAAKIWQPGELAEGAVDTAILEALPGKVPLIKRAYRPPNYETPVDYFREPITRNDAFFVRYHLSGIPTVDLKTWSIKVRGDAAGPGLTLDMAKLRKDFRPVELVAVCQCSGNRRGMFSPHVQGVEWGVGAMGNAKWTGVRLKDVLEKAGITDKAVEIAFNGADGPAIQTTPDFVKTIPVQKAMDDNTIIAFEMNGKPLPHWNGFPARLIVAGWTGTYWMKHLTDIEVRSTPLTNFWMATAYRVPAQLFTNADPFPTQLAPASKPITDIVINSLVTSIHDGDRVKRGQMVDVAGVAWDGGRGIRDVEVSTDGGSSWVLAQLGKDYGNYSFRTFMHKFRVPAEGSPVVMVRAYNNRGDTQVEKLVFNGAGYHHNVVPHIHLEVA